MMELRILSHEGGAPQAAVSAIIGPGGCTFGRGADNTLVLNDPERLVSRNQARIDGTAEGFLLTNVSSANTLLVNDMEIGPGERTRLGPGDQIRVGRFLLGLAGDATSIQAAPQQTATPAPAKPAAATSPSTDPLAAFGMSPSDSGDDVFADILGSEPPALTPRPATATPRASAPQPPTPACAPSPRAVNAPPTMRDAATPAANVDPLAAFNLGASSGDDDAFSDILASAPRPASPPPMAQPAPPAAAPRIPPTSIEPAPAQPARLEIDLFEGLDAPRPDFGSMQDPMSPIPGGLDDLSWASSTKPKDFPAPGAMQNIIPEDFNPFDMPSLAPRNTDDPLSVLGAANATGLDDLLGKGESAPQSLLDNLPEFSSEPLPDTHAMIGLGDGLTRTQPQDDPLALFSEASPFDMLDARGDKVANMRDNTAEIASAFQMPSVERQAVPAAEPPAPEPVPARPVQQAAAASAPPVQTPAVRRPTPGAARPGQAVVASGLDQAKLLAAFFEGAGMSDQPTQTLTPEFMCLLGELLAITAQGTVDLMQARAATKHELRAQVTMIAPQANNPLKFAPDGQAAMAQLVGKRFPGFMPPADAMRDAFNDLRAHQVGMTAGMRAALREVLERFSPDQLEQRITRQTLLESVLPAARKSRLWDLYTDMYQQIKNEAEDEFHSLFGEVFVKTYDEEVGRLTKRDKP